MTDAKPAPKRAASKQPAAPPAPPSYLTEQQINMLLEALQTWRVFENQGQVNVAAYDIRAHLTRIFGYGRWDGEVLAMEPIFDLPWAIGENKAPGAYVAYRCGYRLTVYAMDGTRLARYTEWAMGDSKKTLVNHADAHDMAMKTAESQALKRAAINLGDQFGLSLYHKPNVAVAKQNARNPQNFQPIQALVGMTLNRPTQATGSLQEVQITEEVDPDHAEEFPTRDINQEPTSPTAATGAPVSDPAPVEAQPSIPPADTPQEQAPVPADPVIPEDVAVAIHELDADIKNLPPATMAHLRALWKKDGAPPVTQFQTMDHVARGYILLKQAVDEAGVYDQPASMDQAIPPRSDAAAVARARQIEAARRQFPADVPADNYQPDPEYMPDDYSS